MAGFLGGALYQNGLAADAPHDVAPKALSDRAATPDKTIVRVQAEARLDTLTTTSRGNAMLALVGVPDVIVFCSETQAECSASGPASRTLLGELQAGEDKDIDGVIEKFAKSTLGLSRANARVLNVRTDAGSSGARVRSIVFFVLTAIFAIFVLLGLVRTRALRARVREEEAGAAPRS